MKREVVMCDKAGCKVAAEGKCALCDQDVCVFAHATHTKLTFKSNNHRGQPALPLPILICKDCGTGLVVDASADKYVPLNVSAADAAEKLKPFLEILRAALAKRALGNDLLEPEEDPVQQILASGTTVHVPPGAVNVDFVLAAGEIMVRDPKTGTTTAVLMDAKVAHALNAGSLIKVAQGSMMGTITPEEA